MDEQKALALEQERLEKLKLESQVVQRGLPKPSKINEQAFKVTGNAVDLLKVFLNLFIF